GAAGLAIWCLLRRKLWASAGVGGASAAILVAYPALSIYPYELLSAGTLADLHRGTRDGPGTRNHPGAWARVGGEAGKPEGRPNGLARDQARTTFSSVTSSLFARTEYSTRNKASLRG